MRRTIFGIVMTAIMIRLIIWMEKKDKERLEKEKSITMEQKLLEVSFNRINKFKK